MGSGMTGDVVDGLLKYDKYFSSNVSSHCNRINNFRRFEAKLDAGRKEDICRETPHSLYQFLQAVLSRFYPPQIVPHRLNTLAQNGRDLMQRRAKAVRLSLLDLATDDL